MSNRRFEQIRANVGTIFDAGGMQAYFQRLSENNVDTQEYLEWSISQGASKAPKLEPAEVLTKIKEAALREMSSLLDLSDALTHIRNNVILLAKDEKRKFLLGSDQTALALGRYVPPDEDPEEDDISAGAVRGHPLVIELTVSGAAPQGTTAGPKLPRYVVVLGRLLIHDIRNIEEFPTEDQPNTEIDPENRPYIPTNYAIVMDAVAKERPVWLVYNRAPIDLEVGAQIESAPTDEDQPMLFPPNSNFDSAMILSDVTMWRLGMNALSPTDLVDTVNATKGNSAVLAKSAPDADVRRAMGPPQAG